MNEPPHSVDAASLSRLHDLVLPSPIPWWPLASGWYVAGAILLALVVWSLWRYLSWRKRNAYRHEALRLLRAFPVDPSSLPQLDELLKRVALSAYPRGTVASLSGTSWLKFLDETARDGNFMKGPGCILGEAPYLSSAPQVEMHSILTSAENWIRHHEGRH